MTGVALENDQIKRVLSVNELECGSMHYVR
jgi:hypothetical protein